MALARAGYSVLLVGRTSKKLRDVKDGIAYKVGFGPELETAVADLADPEACASVVGKARSTFGRLDVLVHCAGHAELAPLTQTDPAMWQRAFAINVFAAAELIRAAWPHLVQHDGMVVNVSSMASIDPFEGLGAYAAAKAALNMLTRVTASEGLRSVAIAPGAVETPMLRSLFDEQAIPRASTLTPEAVADLIRDCVTGERAFESGEVILVEP